MARFPSPASKHQKRQAANARVRLGQIRGLLLLAIAALIFSILRAGPDRIFTPGWWRLW